MFDLSKMSETIASINAILNNKGTAEIHNEYRNGTIETVVVETQRKVQNREKNNQCK